jgi:hypothetical protein
MKGSSGRKVSAAGGGAGGSGGRQVERVDYDEKEAIEITVSGDIEVFPSFDAMGLKEDLLRGIYAYGLYLFSNFPWVLNHLKCPNTYFSQYPHCRFRKALCYSAARYQANCARPGYCCPITVGYG